MRRGAASLVILALSGCAADLTPDIASVEPSFGPPGTRVTLRGARFCGTRDVAPDGTCTPMPAGSVSFGIDPEVGAAILGWRDDTIETVVPVGVDGDVLVVVTVDGRTSDGVSFGAHD